jgi:hypothetical protein
MSNKLHPLFQLITDNFREIPEKIAAASIAEDDSDLEEENRQREHDEFVELGRA